MDAVNAGAIIATMGKDAGQSQWAIVKTIFRVVHDAVVVGLRSLARAIAAVASIAPSQNHKEAAPLPLEGRVLDRHRAVGVRDELGLFLDWWNRHGPHVIRVAPDGGLRQGVGAEVRQLQKYKNGESRAKTLVQTPHGPRVVCGKVRGNALDLWPADFDPSVPWEKQPQGIKDAFRVQGETGEKWGFTWGGRWTAAFPNGDQPHLEVPGWENLPIPISNVPDE